VEGKGKKKKKSGMGKIITRTTRKTREEFERMSAALRRFQTRDPKQKISGEENEASGRSDAHVIRHKNLEVRRAIKLEVGG